MKKSLEYLILILPGVLIALTGIAGIDVWWHLKAGSLIAKNGEPPFYDTMTFLSRGRIWIDYAWLFQVVVYSIYSHLGYWGLIAFRTLFAILTFVLLYHALLRKGCEDRAFAFLISLLAFLVYSSRLTDIRPHLFTYFNLVLIVFILSGSNRKLWLLVPFLQLIQANLHGITFVLTLGVILFEAVLSTGREGARDRWIVSFLAAGTTLLNPYFYHILFMPFSFNVKEISTYIVEFSPIPLKDIFNFYPDVRDIPFFAFKVLLWGGVVTIIFNWRKIKVLETVFFVTIAIMGLSMRRFIVEFALLESIYMAKYFYTMVYGEEGLTLGKFVFKWGAIIAGLILMWSYISTNFKKGMYTYPIVEKFYPAGCIEFMKKNKLEGVVFNDPNYGGLIEWFLLPRVQPYIDPRVPTLFTADEYWLMREASYDIDTWRKFSRKLNFDYVLWNRDSGFAKYLDTEVEEFVPVFFDSNGVLFVNKNKHPEVAEKYKLTLLNPFEEPKKYIPRMTFASLIRLESEGLRVLEVWKKNEIIIETLLIAFIQTEDYGRAMDLLEEVTRNLPQEFKFKYYLAYLYYIRGQTAKAISILKKVIKKRSKFPPPYHLLGKIYYELGEFKKAKKWLEKYQLLNNFELTVSELILLGNVYFQLDEYDRALDMYWRAIYFDKKRERIHYILNNIGNVYFQEGEYNNALSYYKWAVEAKKDFLDAWINMGITYKEMGNVNGVLEVLKHIEEMGGVPSDRIKYLREINPSSDK